MKLSGKDGFEKYYNAMFSSRWEKLRDALLLQVKHAKLDVGGIEQYYLDVASIRVALTLPVKNATSILDMCAAPGGKTLVLASLMPKDCVLVSNEFSSNRRSRLKKVCASCLPKNVQERVSVSPYDAKKMCLYKSECYDAILLDAPCSSERHVITNENEIVKWTSSRIKSNAITQWALISSAYRMLKSEGFLLYSTCALSYEENDSIILRLTKKFDKAQVISCVDISSEILKNFSKFCATELPPLEKTEYGFRILPDISNGAGPMYFSLIQKK